MLRILLTLSVFFISLVSFANNDYNELWDAINHNDRAKAKAILQKAKANNATAFEAYVTEIFLKAFENQENNIDGLISQLQKMDKGKNAYLFALWFKGALLGSYGKKTQPHQIDLINKILTDNTFNGSIQAATHYMRSLHYVFSNEHAKARPEWDAMGAIPNWQLVGPFENLSGTGFQSSYGPETTPGAEAKFKGINNVEVHWFTPTKMNSEGWIFTRSHIQENSAVVYAQAFVYAPQDMKVLLNAGGNGSLKIWVNDGLVLSESKERTTELDYYKNYCQLTKGYNRILVKLGYVNNDASNFIVRLTNENYFPVQGLKFTSEAQPYTHSTVNTSGVSLKHFAEEFFEKKIAAEPKNLLNYILLSQTYLRNQRISEARKVLQKALTMAPDNSLLRYELIQALNKSEDRMLLLQEVERLKEKDPDCFLTLQLGIKEQIEKEQYDEAAETLSKMVRLYGEDANTAELSLTILSKQEKYDEFIKSLEKYHKAYPENVTFLQVAFRLKKDLNKDAKGALALYEKFLKSNYNFDIVKLLANEYREQGMNDKYLNVLKTLNKQAGYDPRFSIDLSNYYYEKQNYSSAADYIKEAIQLAPFEGSYWKSYASILEQMNNKEEAIAHYKKALYYNRTDYEARKKLFSLEQKTDAYKLLPQTDVYDLIKKAPATSTEHNFGYIFDEKCAVIYDEGASEEYITYAVRVYNQKGIDSWKELYLDYNGSTQTLLVDKCEVVKANGAKVPAERDDAQVVFTGLEPGDAIYVKYRLQNYTRGRLGKEFWDRFSFNSFFPSQVARYCLVTPKNYKVNAQMLNATTQPVVKEVDEYKIQIWELKDIAAIKDEPLMPSTSDIGTVLHLSTLNSWADVANWYSDIAYQDYDDDLEVNALYDEIFAGKKGLTQTQKARMIYDYIVTNIRYSSVSFRQSGLVPQDLSKIINTKLGDCKDLSSLFAALAKKAGLQAQLVLVNTRNYGVKELMLPSMDFNHCIVYTTLDGKEYYLELTDSHLPFGSLPSNLFKAVTLTIPHQDKKSNSIQLKPLVSQGRTTDKLVKDLKATVSGKDLKFTVVSQRIGALTSGWRESYASLSETDLSKTFEESISSGYKNPVKLNEVRFTGLDRLDDSVVVNYSYIAKNEVIEAGSMKMFRVPLIDVVASIDNFSADSRVFPIEYWSYENTDVYESTIQVQLEPGQKLVEVPADQTFTFKNSTYKIRYTRTGDSLKIYRYAKLDRENILPADYTAFKKFFADIIETESKYIVFK
jgi:tetratricopeptide (TPR) repeat protein/transglutaminase-like putative cysteine protease